jgi:hypothetical protein
MGTPVPAARAIKETVQIMAAGLKPGLVSQLVLLAEDLKRGGHADNYISSGMRALIEEIAKEKRPG